MQPSTLFAGLATLLAAVQALPQLPGAAGGAAGMEGWQKSDLTANNDECTATLWYYPTRNPDGVVDGAKWMPRIECDVVSSKHKTARAVMDIKENADLESYCVSNAGGTAISSTAKWMPKDTKPRSARVEFGKC